MASSGPYLPSLSIAPSARHYLRQEPDARNPLVRIRAGVRSDPYPYRDANSAGAKRRALYDAYKHTITLPAKTAKPPQKRRLAAVAMSD